jgi:hypothetical protein
VSADELISKLLLDLGVVEGAAWWGPADAGVLGHPRRLLEDPVSSTIARSGMRVGVGGLTIR